MPPRNKGLTKEEVRAYLKKRWKKEGNCPICDNNTWNVVEEEYCLPARFEAKNFPVSLIVCETCGAVTYFAAEVIRRGAG